MIQIKDEQVKRIEDVLSSFRILSAPALRHPLGGHLVDKELLAEACEEAGKLLMDISNARRGYPNGVSAVEGI